MLFRNDTDIKLFDDNWLEPSENEQALLKLSAYDLKDDLSTAFTAVMGYVS